MRRGDRGGVAVRSRREACTGSKCRQSKMEHGGRVQEIIECLRARKNR